MQKRFASLVLVLLLAVIVGTVAAQDDPFADVDPTGATITYWHEWDGRQGEGITAIIEAFNADNEWGITVEQFPQGRSSDVRANISTAITSGDLPNIGGAGFVTDAMGYYLDGVLLTYDAFLDSPTWGLTDEEAADLNFDLINLNRPTFGPFVDELLAWPVGFSSEIMSTNTDLLADMFAAGLIDFEGAPTDTDQFRQAACAASELEGVTAGYGGRLSSPHLMTWMANFGGQVWDSEAGAYVFTDEGALAGMQFVQDLFNDGCMYFADGGNFANTGEFSLGLNVFAPGSSVGVPFIQGDMDDAGLEYNWANVLFPANEGRAFLSTSRRGIVMFQNTPEENVATWLFIKYWATNVDAQVNWIENAQYQPINTATKGNLSEDFLTTNTQFNDFATALSESGVTFISVPEHPSQFQVSDAVAELFSNITIGGMDVAEAAANAEAEVNEIYQEDLENVED